MSKNIAKIRNQTLHSSAEIFGKNWHFFQKIIKHNHMKHKEIYDVLHQFIFNYPAKLFSFLDLVFGELSTIITCLIDGNIYSYTGVDLSPQASQASKVAQKNIAYFPG